MAIIQQDIQRAVQELALSNKPLCVHSSLRSFGWVEGGAQAIIDGLLAEGCTILVPTFTWWFSTLAPPHRRLLRNAYDYDRAPAEWWEKERLYTPELTESSEDMGAIPRTIAALPGRVRGSHPLVSFSAVGPRARELVSAQAPHDAFAPLKALIEMNGWVVLMGVALNRMTLLHLAEQSAGRNLFRRWARDATGRPLEVEADGCSEGFGKLEPILRPLLRECCVGNGRWKVYPAQESMARAAEAIRDDPQLTHCDDPMCDRCNDAVLGGPIL